MIKIVSILNSLIHEFFLFLAEFPAGLEDVGIKMVFFSPSETSSIIIVSIIKVEFMPFKYFLASS